MWLVLGCNLFYGELFGVFCGIVYFICCGYGGDFYVFIGFVFIEWRLGFFDDDVEYFGGF